MSTDLQSSAKAVQERGVPSSAVISGILLAIVGVLGFVNSYLILASSIIFGWLIVGLIGFFSIVAGISIIQDLEWGYSAGMTLGILNLFVGFIELIGAINVYYAIRGWIGIGQAIGISTLILSAVALYLMSRAESKRYFDY